MVASQLTIEQLHYRRGPLCCPFHNVAPPKPPTCSWKPLAEIAKAILKLVCSCAVLMQGQGRLCGAVTEQSLGKDSTHWEWTQWDL